MLSFPVRTGPGRRRECGWIVGCGSPERPDPAGPGGDRRDRTGS